MRAENTVLGRLNLTPHSADSSAPVIATFSKIALNESTVVNISSQQDFSDVTELVTNTVKDTYSKFESLVGPITPFQVHVKLLRPDVFTLATGAPEWTNALFFKDTIIIPVKSDRSNADDLIRSVRHEFTHAIIHALSDGSCPGWLDEGMAQYMEGETLPLVQMALAAWMKDNPHVPFNMLQNGFTKLDKKYVAPAYAESLWATKMLVQERGFIAIRNFFELKKKHVADAFHISLGESESSFEQRLECTISKPECIKNISLCKMQCIGQGSAGMQLASRLLY